MRIQRKIKAWCFLSLDGFTLRYGGDADFIIGYPRPESEDYGFGAFIDSIGCAVINRAQYDNLQGAGLWPMEGKPCYIAARESFPLPLGTDIRIMITGEDSEKSFIAQLRDLQGKPGKDIWLAGNHELSSLLFERQMIDEITISILPLTLGSGLPLFCHNNGESLWALVYCRPFDNGVLQAKYRIIR